MACKWDLKLLGRHETAWGVTHREEEGGQAGDRPQGAPSFREQEGNLPNAEETGSDSLRFFCIHPANPNSALGVGLWLALCPAVACVTSKKLLAGEGFGQQNHFLISDLNQRHGFHMEELGALGVSGLPFPLQQVRMMVSIPQGFAGELDVLPCMSQKDFDGV